MGWTTSTDIGHQSGKTFIVTGANAGIGFATAQALAAKHATVIMACRNTDKGIAAAAKIKAAVDGADVTFAPLDLASLASIREFADAFARDHQRLDVLINNAGIMVPPLGRTSDGFESQFGTNFLGPFALTGLLLPLLARTPGSRVVNMSSVAHWSGRINFENLNAEKGYSRIGAYCQSKLADLLFSNELQRRLQFNSMTTISVGSHPGGTQSELSRHSLLAKFVQPYITQSTAAGAMPSLRAAVDPQVQGGDYYGPGGFLTMRGSAVKQKSSARSHDKTVAARLWQTAEQMTGVHYL